MNIGLLGGSFNPIHNAHLRIAREAQAACALDRIIFIPAADPPHKPVAGDISFEHRAAMVSLALAGSHDFEMSTIEAERGGKSYSIDTIRAFRARFPADELYFIIGGDSFLDIGSWYRCAEIFSSCHLIVVERPGSHIDDPHEALPDAVRNAYRADSASGILIHPSGSRILYITGSPLELSSTEIRHRAAAGDDLAQYVPPDVAAYISQQRIYH
jgi:nicotinate-nucleotide adenylyltransferase